MRVIAGEFRGATLLAPPGQHTRPITDRAKETLFNILGHSYGEPGALPDFEVLDLFAGTGGLGIEALSRGARRAVFVERDRRALPALRGNLQKLRVTGRSLVVAENVWSMRPPHAQQGAFGLIFLDPPYRDSENLLRVLDLLERLAARLAADGQIVFRRASSPRRFPADGLVGLALADERRIGSMDLLFFVRAEPAAALSDDDRPS